MEEAGGPEGVAETLKAEGVDEASSEMLAREYGVAAPKVLEQNRTPILPGRPEVLGQVDWAVDREFALRLSDVLLRRTSLGLRAARLSLEAMDQVASRMAAKLGWDAERTAEEKRRYEEFVREQMAFAWEDGAESPTED